MRSQALTIILLTAIIAANVSSTPAFETDQYSLPPQPLADIGDELSAHVVESIAVAIKNVNDEIALHETCINKTAAKDIKCTSDRTASRKLVELRTPDAIAAAVYDQLGDGSIFTTVTSKWFGKHKFAHEPSRYKPDYGDSIFITRPINYATLSPTVRVFGSEFGFDKMDHFFQQGHKYYKLYNDAVAEGKSPADATKKAIKWGKRTERTYFGTLVSGVYSNADLFANFAGMKFYQNLTSDLTLGDRKLSPMIVLSGGKWGFNDQSDIKDVVLKPFIGDQLNEALNSSAFSFLLVKVVRSVVKKKDCPDWRKAYPNATAEEFKARSAHLEKWNGEDYGFTKKSKTVPIAVCFEEKLLSE